MSDVQLFSFIQAGDLIVDDFQYEYNGLLMGAGTPYELQSLTGLTSVAPVRSGSVDRMASHGGTPGRHYTGIRTIVGTVDIFDGGDGSAFADLRDALQDAFAVRSDPNDQPPFVWKHPGRPLRRVYARCIDFATPMDRMFSLNYGQFSFRLEATDPWVYDNDLQSVTLVPGETIGGLQFPLQFPLVFGTGGAGSQSVLNAGKAPAPWTATITGETPSPRITHVESGRYLELSGLVVASGDTLEIDANNRTILYNGTASRRGLLTAGSSWFWLQPGLNTIQFSSSGVTSGNMTFRWHNTNWSD